MVEKTTKITIQPLGTIGPEPLARIRIALEVAYSAELSLSLPEKLPSAAWMQSRQQHDSARIIGFLESRSRARQDKVLGVCDVDLGSPILTFVFGVAQVGGSVAVMSLHRLRPEAYGLPPNQALFLERCAKAAIHEIGHTFGLKHCFRYNCIMHSSESIEGSDLKGQEFCRRCAEKLATLRQC